MNDHAKEQAELRDHVEASLKMILHHVGPLDETKVDRKLLESKIRVELLTLEINIINRALNRTSALSGARFKASKGEEHGPRKQEHESEAEGGAQVDQTSSGDGMDRSPAQDG